MVAVPEHTPDPVVRWGWDASPMPLFTMPSCLLQILTLMVFGICEGCVCMIISHVSSRQWTFFYCVPRLIIFCRALWMTSSQVIKLMGYLAWKCVHRIMHIFASCLMSEDVCWVRYLCSGWSPFCYWVASVVLVFINLMAECFIL